ncbi:MAG: hypothetical protein F4118_07710 [Acidimicrobiaceae bacterium]|nr:hypothetical protein [Candidatus Poribacteria bacterium]MYI36303.1 hypothetical protein [Acidimicrobiaceae bacterium]
MNENTDKVSNIEQLSAAQHAIWASWVKHHLEHHLQDDGTIVIPKEKVDAWKVLVDTDYEDLTDAMKEKDREVVYEHLSEVPILRDALKSDSG